MFVRRPISPTSAEARELSIAAAKRKSIWFSNVCAVAAAFAGSFGVAAVILGYRASRQLPDVAANSGQKFTESAGALFGGLIGGAVFELIAVLLLAVALIHSPRRLRTLLAGLPLLVFALVLLAL
jgi:hypothetical protein